MKSGICLFWIAVGAIFTFAVTANTSVFNLHVAGFVVMVIGIIGLVTPRRGYEWLGRRVVVRRTRRGGTTRVEEKSYPRYVLRNPGTAEPGAGPRGGPLAGAGPDPGGGDGDPAGQHRWRGPLRQPPPGAEAVGAQRHRGDRGRLRGAARVGQAPPPASPEQARRSSARHGLGTRIIPGARPVWLLSSLAARPVWPLGPFGRSARLAARPVWLVGPFGWSALWLLSSPRPAR
jgi:hypothetical protein